LQKNSKDDIILSKAIKRFHQISTFGEEFGIE